MSHNTEPEQDAREHRPALIAILVAVLAAIAFVFVFQPGVDGRNAEAVVPQEDGAFVDGGAAADLASDRARVEEGSLQDGQVSSSSAAVPEQTASGVDADGLASASANDGPGTGGAVIENRSPGAAVPALTTGGPIGEPLDQPAR